MTSYGNRGMELEDLITASCNGYKSRGSYYIDKIPTPWKVNYNKKSGQVRSAFPEKKGMVDFIGYDKNGRFVCFDAKQTNKKSLPFDMVQKHQTDYLMSASRKNAMAFLVVYFKSVEEYYRIDINEYMRYKINTDRKSIPIKYFRDNCKRLKRKFGMLEFMEDLEVEKQKGV